MKDTIFSFKKILYCWKKNKIQLSWACKVVSIISYLKLAFYWRCNCSSAKKLNNMNILEDTAALPTNYSYYGKIHFKNMILMDTLLFCYSILCHILDYIQSDVLWLETRCHFFYLKNCQGFGQTHWHFCSIHYFNQIHQIWQ